MPTLLALVSFQGYFALCRYAELNTDFEADVPTSMIERTIHDYG